jgi:hypothetical protein
MYSCNMPAANFYTCLPVRLKVFQLLLKQACLNNIANKIIGKLIFK